MLSPRPEYEEIPADEGKQKPVVLESVPYTCLFGNAVSAENLFDYLQRTIASRPPPRFVAIFTLDDKSLKVVLPPLDKDASRLFVRPDDAPALRGVRLTDDRRLRNLSSHYSMEVEDQGQRCAKHADSETDIPLENFERWNKRCRNGLFAPWIPLHHSGTNEMERSAGPWVTKSSREQAFEFLRTFLASDSEGSYFIFTQCAYGWDVSLLQEVAARDLMLDQPARLQIKIQEKTPCLAFRRFIGQFHQRLFRQTYGSAFLEKALLGMFVVSLFAIPVFGFSGRYIAAMLAATASLLAICFAATVSIVSNGNGCVFDATGVAWDLRAIQSCNAQGQERSQTDSAPVPTSDSIDMACPSPTLAEVEWWQVSKSAIIRALRRGEEGYIFLEDSRQ